MIEIIILFIRRCSARNAHNFREAVQDTFRFLLRNLTTEEESIISIGNQGSEPIPGAMYEGSSKQSRFVFCHHG